MNIILNGEAKDVCATTVQALIEELQLEIRMLAVERNLEVVAKSTYADTLLQEHDKIEIVHMIGGG
ncbi:MAG: sulfur carrier protein ThiS [Mariprofundaceae bacterium]|nr:sulfur carrier protein ThiS [Mariprofundaceae bacterium]